jgi:hypothetical protein
MYGLPFIQLPPEDSNLIARQLKRLLIIPLRKSLGLPHNAHHASIFIETRTLPIHYLQLHHSVLLAKRYIFQAQTQREQQQRYKQLFEPGAGEHTTGLIESNPLFYLRTRCLSIHSPITANITALEKATSKHIWNAIFDLYYQTWYAAQHSSHAAPEPHSLFPCYNNNPSCQDKSLPLYLTTLPPTDAATIARLRFNRSRLNQSLFKRHRSDTDKCPNCSGTVETVEHVLMSCPRYDKERFECFCTLAGILKKAPLSCMFPFPFMLCAFPPTTIKTHQPQLVQAISTFLRKVRRMRDM